MDDLLLYHNVTQGSEEWLDLRLGRITGTRTKSLLGPLTKADVAAGEELNKAARTLAYKLASEKETRQSAESDFKSYWMERGAALEPYARKAYEDEYFQDVVEIGFISKGEYMGISLDGKVGDDGLLEIKCPSGPEYLRMLYETNDKSDIEINGAIKPEYMAQMQWALALTGREYVDNYYYHPGFSKRSINFRIYRDADWIERLLEKAELVIHRTKAVRAIAA